MQISTIGIDLSKNVFQVHGVDAAGGVDHQKTAAVGGAGLFCEATTMPHGYGGLRHITSLGP
jgi:hypothetical protein